MNNANNKAYLGPTSPSGDYKRLDTLFLEEQALAELIQNPDCISRVRDFIAVDSFSTDVNKAVWKALDEMDTKGDMIDIMTVFKRVPAVQKIVMRYPGGVTELATEEHCRALAACVAKRQAGDMLYQAAIACSKGSLDPGALADLADKLRDLDAGSGAKDSSRDFIDFYNDRMDEIEEELAMLAKGKRVQVPTSIPSLDDLLLGGFRKKNLITLAARPGCGKSALLLQMVSAAHRAGFKVAVYSVEMPGEEVVDRILLATGDIKPRQLSATKSFEGGEARVAADRKAREDVFLRVQDLQHIPIIDRLNTLDGIEQDIRIRHRQGRCDVAFIDHLHHLQADPGADNEVRDLSNKVLRLKALAKECDIPIVLLCQLNRDPAKGKQPPQMEDLKGCGKIEEVSDVILMLEKGETDGQVAMWVRKNRRGRGGDVCIILDTHNYYTTFTEVIENQQDEY